MTARRRVLLLVPGAFGDRGGIADYCRHLIRALATLEGWEVRALGLHGDPDSTGPTNVRWRVPAPGSKPRFAIAALREALVHRPDVVVSGLAGFAPLALTAKTLARSRLWTLTYGQEVFTPGSALERRGLQRSDLITAISRYTRDRLRDWCPLPDGRVRLLPCTVDLERFTPGSPPASLVDRYRVEGRPILLTVSRLHPDERYKGHDRLIRVLPRLIERRGPVLYLIAGEGADRHRLENLARASGVADAVAFAGHVPDDELSGYYRLADLFAMPSTREGFGIVFLEAMACGCPVLAGNADGSVDALADGELGTLVDPLDDDALVAGIEQALDRPPRRDAPIPGVERFSTLRFAERAGALLETLDF